MYVGLFTSKIHHKYILLFLELNWMFTCDLLDASKTGVTQPGTLVDGILVASGASFNRVPYRLDPNLAVFGILADQLVHVGIRRVGNQIEPVVVVASRFLSD